MQYILLGFNGSERGHGNVGKVLCHIVAITHVNIYLAVLIFPVKALVPHFPLLS